MSQRFQALIGNLNVPASNYSENCRVTTMTPQHQIRTTTTPLTDVVGEGPFEAVEDEPAFLPGLDLASHLHQVALTHLLCEDDLVAGVHAVARRLDVGAQVELLLPYGQVAGHRAGLEPAEHGRLTVRTCLDFILQPDWFLMKLAVLIKRKVWKCFIFGILSMKRWTVLWWCSHTGLHSTLVWKWSTVNVLNTPSPHPQQHMCVKSCHVFSRRVESFSTFPPCRLN